MRVLHRDDGQAAVFVLVAVAVLFVVVSSALAAVGGHMVDRTRAQTAADAAALGSLSGGRAAAVRLAAAQDGDIVSWEAGPGPHEVTVVVRVGDLTATARASDAP